MEKYILSMSELRIAFYFLYIVKSEYSYTKITHLHDLAYTI